MEHIEPIKTVIPDARGRINLGDLAKDISKFVILRDVNSGNIILEPYVDVPQRELWLYNNKEALRSVKEGFQQSKEGKVSGLEGSLAKALQEEIDEL